MTDTDRIWLDVPYSDNKRVKALGAQWAWWEKRWYAEDPFSPELEPWRAKPPISGKLFGEDRSFGGGLFVDLIPQTCWFTNVRSCVSNLDWSRIRRMVAGRAGNRCEICGTETDPAHKMYLEAHERFEFNSASRVQTLRRLICLCRACHTTTHFGLARKMGNEQLALAHLMRVNKWGLVDALLHVNEAFSTWERRSKKIWKLDTSMLEGIGVEIVEAPEASDRKRQAIQRIEEIRRREEGIG